MSFFANESSVYEVHKWIKDLFEDTEVDIPDFRKSHECMKLISDLISINKETEKDAEETIKIELYLADHYTKKSEEMSCNFSCEFSMNDLHPDIAENIKKIASVGTQMKLKEPTVTNFLLSSSALNNKREYYIEQELVNGFALSKFSKKISDIIHKNVILERNIEVLERKVTKQQAIKPAIHEQCKFFKTKGEEYANRIKKAEKQLRSHGWDASLSHNDLVKRSESLQHLEQEANKLTSKLESYQNLPPNEMLTQFKMEEAQTELLRLQKEFDSLLKVIS